MNVADVAPAGTVTDAGAGSAVVLLDDSATTLPPVGAAWFRLAVHVVTAPDTRLDGAHTREDTRGLGVTVTVVLALTPSVAVAVTLWEVATDPVVTVNAADVAAAGTVTDVGTGSALALLDESATMLPPTGAACVRVTVHVVDRPDTTLAGTHASEATLGLPPPPADADRKAAI